MNDRQEQEARNGWTFVGPTTRWATIWTTKDGYVCLNAFSSGAWSITRKAAATDDNPHGIVASSWDDGPVGASLGEAMAAAEKAAASFGAVKLGPTASASLDSF